MGEPRELSKVKRHVSVVMLRLLSLVLVSGGVLLYAPFPLPVAMSLETTWPGLTLIAVGCGLSLFGILQTFRTSRTVNGWRRYVPRVFAVLAALVCLAGGAAAIVYFSAYGSCDVRIEGDDTVLSGTVFMLRGQGPFPGIVLIHGTSPSLRHGYLHYADFFARRGYAVLIYDKRGCGLSTGELEFAGVHDLASDALAGFELLTGLPEVDAARSGFWGYSQGGALAPLAASLSGRAAFVICLSGPGLTLGEQMMHCNGHWMRDEEVAGLRQRVWDYYYNHADYETLYADLTAARGHDWYATAGFPPKLATPEEVAAGISGSPFTWMGKYMNYDPIPTLIGLDCPVLMFYGDRDSIVPPGESIRRINWAMEQSGEEHDITIMEYHGVGHDLVAAWESSGNGFMPTYPDGYLETLETWLKEVASDGA